jgi:intermediate peptidase
MEYFASDPRVLSRINRHYKTGESLPDDVIETFCATKKVFSSVDVHTQLFYSLVDQRYHSDHPLGCSTTEMLSSLHAEHHVLPYHENTAWQHRFSHLVGYGARYYSYLMARSVASCIWQKCFQDEPLNPDAGRRYRAECLAHGGGKPSHRLVSDFLEKEVNPEDLSEALVAEIDAKTELLKATMARKKPS